ncbi:hypothetical protein Tco_0800891 [Tanacetum coccineum]|uniref:Uncharacterized protein n=1 Tax=Tanacetum coccineum TaxID=301880 RepID=A0ABQ4ZYV0_9ASTR
MSGVVKKYRYDMSSDYSRLNPLGVMSHKKERRLCPDLLWRTLVDQVENKNVKRINKMYYPRFTKVIINFFMTKDSLILRRNRVNWHFARDDPMVTTIKKPLNVQMEVWPQRDALYKLTAITLAVPMMIIKLLIMSYSNSDNLRDGLGSSLVFYHDEEDILEEGSDLSSVSSGFISNMLNPSPDTCIDAIFNINTKSTSLVDVPVTTIAETPLLFARTLPPPPIPLIPHPQQTPIPTPTTVPIPIIPNFVANLFELELKKILIDKMESNKSIHRSDEQKNLYKALVDALERKRPQRQLEGLTEGSKSHHKSAGESAQAEEPMHTAKDLEEPAHQEFKTGVTEDQPDEETSQLPDWFQN